MCMCETTFEVCALACFCLLYHGLSVFVLLTKETKTTSDYVTLVYYGASAAIALVLLLGAMMGNKGMVDFFVLCAKIRLLLYCLLAGFLVFTIYSSKGSKGHGIVHPLMIIPYVLAWLPAKMAKSEQVVDVQAFVIYRVQVFSDNKLGQ
ncbi:uncharacterized protein LOC142771341 isoform X2 [Rhipicephalus microplus]|uniref:uncharacterized protein LOC142771341 isoform X2 n=1 Tax=Rhipicephalus microplus TaxID=6941 RepID=UPI003F6B04A3